MLSESGRGKSVYGYTGEATDVTGLIYLRARFYSPWNGRFISRDPLLVEGDLYQYVLSNPIMYIDPSGLIAQGDEADKANKIVNELKALNINILVDWGDTVWSYYFNDPVDSARSGIRTGCSWEAGRWSLLELNLVKFTVQTMNLSFGRRFASLIRPIKIEKIPGPLCNDPDARGCAAPNNIYDGRWIQLIDNGRLPTNPDMSSNIIVSGSKQNFDAFSIAHEIGHAWDLQHNGDYHRELVSRIIFSGNTFDCQYDTYNKLPGCNKANYYYGGTPLYGASNGFNSLEDFANSVAVYVFPINTQNQVERAYANQSNAKYGSGVTASTFLEYHNHLYWSLNDLRTNARWLYINELVGVRPRK